MRLLEIKCSYLIRNSQKSEEEKYIINGMKQSSVNVGIKIAGIGLIVGERMTFYKLIN